MMKSFPRKLRNAIAKVERRADRLPSGMRRPALWVAAAGNHLLGSVLRASDSPDLIALTFDDGPDPEVTPRILDVLEAHGARATFFLLTNRAASSPDLVERLVRAGHEPALHGVDHHNLTRLPLPEVFRRLRHGRQELERISSTPIRYFRPPYGAQGLGTFFLTRALGLQVVLWSVDPQDWKDQQLDALVATTTSKAGQGDIVLLHDGYEPNPDHPSPPPTYDRAAALDSVLGHLERSGIRAVTVSELLSAGGARLRPWFDEG